MPLQGDYVPSSAQWVRDQVEQIERSGGTEGTTLRGVPVIVMTNKGAKTGALRKTPVMRVEHEGRYAAVASRGGAPTHPVWYYNLLANPLVEVRDGTTSRDMIAREVTGEEKALWWRRAVEVWPAYAEYQQKTSRDIPVFVLEPA
jgi:F420H(2)-dependent quinone reductase